MHLLSSKTKEIRKWNNGVKHQYAPDIPEDFKTYRGLGFILIQWIRISDSRIITELLQIQLLIIRHTEV